MKHTYFKAIFLLLFLLTVQNSRAISPDPSPLTLSAALAETDYPPFYFVQDGKLRGISIEVLNHVARNLDITINYQRLSWPRVLQSLEKGTVDMVTTFFNTAERAPMVTYTGVPHAFESQQFFTLTENPVTYDGDLESMSAYRIGTIRGYSYGKQFDNSEFLLKEAVLDEPTLVRMLLGERFDVAVGNPFAISLQAEKLQGSDRIRFLDIPVDRSPIYMAISRQHPQALRISARLTRAIVLLKESEDYQAMLKRYDMASD